MTIEAKFIPKMLMDNADKMCAVPLNVISTNWYAWDKGMKSWCQYYKHTDGRFSFNGWISDAKFREQLVVDTWCCEPFNNKSDLLPIIENQ